LPQTLAPIQNPLFVLLTHLGKAKKKVSFFIAREGRVLASAKALLPSLFYRRHTYHLIHPADSNPTHCTACGPTVNPALIHAVRRRGTWARCLTCNLYGYTCSLCRSGLLLTSSLLRGSLWPVCFLPRCPFSFAIFVVTVSGFAVTILSAIRCGRGTPRPVPPLFTRGRTSVFLLKTLLLVASLAPLLQVPWSRCRS